MQKLFRDVYGSTGASVELSGPNLQVWFERWERVDRCCIGIIAWCEIGMLIQSLYSWGQPLACCLQSCSRSFACCSCERFIRTIQCSEKTAASVLYQSSSLRSRAMSLNRDRSLVHPCFAITTAATIPTIYVKVSGMDGKRILTKYLFGTEVDAIMNGDKAEIGSIWREGHLSVRIIYRRVMCTTESM